MQKRLQILAIETSADDTGVAILEAVKTKVGTKFKVLANKIHTQIDIHTEYGGIFPMMAKREHDKNMVPTIIGALKEAKMFALKKYKGQDKKLNSKIIKILERENNLADLFIEFIYKIKKPDIDAIAVTVGPGLEPALWAGISTARALSTLWNIPIVPVNHMEGHMLSSLVQKKKTFTYDKKTLRFPVLSLLISGGHTEIVLVKEFGKYKIIGSTRDDAAGEAFDKVARMLALPYPGGPEISKLAEAERKRLAPLLSEEGVGGGDSKKIHPLALAGTPPPQGGEEIQFPRPMIYSKDFDFSFSGLKTAVLYYIRDNGPLTEEMKSKIAKEFEDAVVDVLVAKTLKAVEKYGAKCLILGGGVSGNVHLQRILKREVKKAGKDIAIHFPTRILSTDNALMIAIAGYFQYQKKKSFPKLKAMGNLSL